MLLEMETAVLLDALVSDEATLAEVVGKAVETLSGVDRYRPMFPSSSIKAGPTQYLEPRPWNSL